MCLRGSALWEKGPYIGPSTRLLEHDACEVHVHRVICDLVSNFVSLGYTGSCIDLGGLFEI